MYKDKLSIDFFYQLYGLFQPFSKYLDNLSFGDYIRKMRIEKAIMLMETTKYPLTEIAYLTGFSDQSHFNRITMHQQGQTDYLTFSRQASLAVTLAFHYKRS